VCVCASLAAISSGGLMAEMGDSAGLESLDEIVWEVETIEQILTDLRCFYDVAQHQWVHAPYMMCGNPNS
jgi:hypothetical protein